MTRFPQPFFYFDASNASSGPRSCQETLLAFIRRLATDDGDRLRCLMNRCLARYDQPRKRRDLMGRLQRGDDRQQAGVIAELLLGELLHKIATRTEIEPGHGQGVLKPDFRIHDAEGKRHHGGGNSFHGLQR